MDSFTNLLGLLASRQPCALSTSAGAVSGVSVGVGGGSGVGGDKQCNTFILVCLKRLVEDADCVNKAVIGPLGQNSIDFTRMTSTSGGTVLPFRVQPWSVCSLLLLTCGCSLIN